MTGRTGTLRDHSRSMHELLKRSDSDDLSLKRINEKYLRNLDDLDVVCAQTATRDAGYRRVRRPCRAAHVGGSDCDLQRSVISPEIQALDQQSFLPSTCSKSRAVLDAN